MRAAVFLLSLVVVCPLARAQVTDRVLFGSPDALGEPAADHQLTLALAKLPMRTDPHGRGHQMRSKGTTLEDGLTPDECDSAMLALYLIRQRIRAISAPRTGPLSGPGYDDYDLKRYVDTDARWLGEGWKNCEYFFGPLYQYQPLAKPDEQPKRSTLAVEPQMTEAACDDLEDRIAEVGATVALYTGTGAHADDMDAPRQLYTWGNNLLYLQAARRYCPEMAAKVAPELIKTVNGSTVRVQRELIMNPLMNAPQKARETAPAARPLPKGFEAGCNIGPSGGECTFTNSTKRALSVCVTVRVHSKADNYDIVSTPVCSGKVPARTSSKAFKLAFAGEVSLRQLCMGTRKEDDGHEINEWLEGDCTSEVSAVP